jgi:hypothetical protein
MRTESPHDIIISPFWLKAKGTSSMEQTKPQALTLNANSNEVVTYQASKKQVLIEQPIPLAGWLAEMYPISHFCFFPTCCILLFATCTYFYIPVHALNGKPHHCINLKHDSVHIRSDRRREASFFSGPKEECISPLSHCTRDWRCNRKQCQSNLVQLFKTNLQKKQTNQFLLGGFTDVN